MSVLHAAFDIHLLTHLGKMIQEEEIETKPMKPTMGPHDGRILDILSWLSC